MSDDDSKSDNRAFLKYVAFLVLGTAAIMGLLHWRERHLDHHGRSKLLGARRLLLADGRPVLLLVESVLHPGGEDADSWEGRLDVVDATTGSRLARGVRIDASDCLPAGPNRIWCDERDGEPPRNRGVVLRDLASLALVASEKQMKAAVPALQKGIATSPYRPAVDEDAGSIVLPINDGTFVSIESAQCPSCTSRAIDVRDGGGRRPFGKHATAKLSNDGELGFDGPSRKNLVRYNAGKPAPLGTETFLSPSFVGDSDAAAVHGKALVLEDGLRLVVHADSLDAAKAKTELSAVDASGGVRWRSELGHGELIGAWRAGDRIVLAMRADESWVVALDTATGRFVWRYDA